MSEVTHRGKSGVMSQQQHEERHEEHYATSHAGHAMSDGHQDHSGHSGHGEHAGHAEKFRNLFWINLILSIPVVLYSEMVQEWLRFSPPDFAGSDWIPPVLGTIVFLYGGSVFLTGGRDEIRQRKPGMMLLISLAIVVAFLASAATTLG